MKQIEIILILLLISGLSACEPEEIPGGGGGENIDLTTGRAEFDFTFQDFRVPASGLHRIDLSLSKDAISLYRGEFLAAANVSDVKNIYIIKLPPGDYYWQAGITCSSKGDTCLWGGFPGGRYGAKWTMGKIEIIKGETTSKKINFQ
ncbi:MAG: hypothetical protein HN352_03075 [Bacteroidetes bacterium]|jgi:hypothetical protein|nr:hypothetical protein [Bacteroidota bacterium]MBT4401075.1 hypothetical protein [Bacteroidota bacterium]MBT4408643.1 hypothetical protein [Bacteroidota bacterium]MBT5427979.1 hypothetical protein [Bacteroidota bacterium]MBT7092237.1 hypothetical protein [Bacteroidota bacterium]